MALETSETKALRTDTVQPKKVSEKKTPIDDSNLLGNQPTAIRRQQMMVGLMNLGMFLAGMSLSLPAVTLNQLTDPKEEFHLDKSQASWYASASSIACPLGCFTSIFIVDRFGRKMGMVCVNSVGTISWALMATAFFGDSNFMYVQLIISRVVSGIATGMGGSPGSVYGAEVCLPKYRARLTMVTSMAIAGGVLFAYVVGYFFRTDWRLIGMVFFIYQVTCLILMIPIRETPNWLLMRGRVEEAKASLSYFRGLKRGETHPEVEEEFATMRRASQHVAGEPKVSIVKSFCLPEVYKPFFTGVFFFVFQQFSGTFVIVVYSVQIITKAGVKIDAFLCSIYLGIARFIVASFIMTWELERWGRRPVVAFSAISSACCLFVLAGASWFTWLQIPILSAVVIVLFVLASAGQWAIPFMILAEIFPPKVRGSCVGVTMGMAYTISFAAIKLYPSMSDYLGNGNVFAFYGSMSLLLLVFVYYFLPETKGKTFAEIAIFFNKEKAVQGDVNSSELKEVFLPKNS